MGGSSAAVQKAFTAETASAFGFLVSEFGLAGPEFRDLVLRTVMFAGRGVRYEIMLDHHEMYVTTHVNVVLDTVRLSAELSELVRAAGLGAPNHVARSAHTMHGLRHALESQASYVRLLQPHLSPEAVVALMRAANARERNVP